jgi:TetR/AcrR family transcriptional regulator of autoinduction and epiphytic fitness
MIYIMSSQDANGVSSSDSTAAPGLRPVATRRGRKKARTRAEIYQAGLALFQAHGFEAVTIPQICAAADVARATFFLHFASKTALLVELNAQLASDLHDRLTAQPGRSAAEYRMAVDLLAERWPHQPGVLAALLRELLAERSELATAPAAGQDLRGVVEGIVRRGQQRGELRRNLSARLAATLFLSGTAAVLSGAVFGEGEATAEEMRNQLLQAVLHGLLEPKPRLKWRRPEAGGSPDAKS